jgi:hypothetical protein
VELGLTSPGPTWVVVHPASRLEDALDSEVGGYDESLGGGEDWDIHTRHAGRARSAVSRTPSMHKKWAYGRSAAGFLGKHFTGDFSGAMLPPHRRSWRIFARDPAHALGFVVLRLGEAGALAAGISVEWIARRRTLRSL